MKSNLFTDEVNLKAYYNRGVNHHHRQMKVVRNKKLPLTTIEQYRKELDPRFTILDFCVAFVLWNLLKIYLKFYCHEKRLTLL